MPKRTLSSLEAFQQVKCAENNTSTCVTVQVYLHWPDSLHVDEFLVIKFYAFLLTKGIFY